MHGSHPFGDNGMVFGDNGSQPGSIPIKPNDTCLDLQMQRLHGMVLRITELH